MALKVKEAENAMKEYVVDLIDTCPHCRAKVHIEQLWNGHHKLRNRDYEFYVIFKCRPCSKLILKTFLFEQNKYSEDQLLTPSGWKEKYPLVLNDEISDEERKFFPPEVLMDYQEALKCQSIGASRASSSMFRRALQNSMLGLGADHNLDLIKQIQSLDSLPDNIKDWAHQIRIFGNWGAHPDKDNLKQVTPEDVEEVHDFISKFLTSPGKRRKRDSLSAALQDCLLAGY